MRERQAARGGSPLVKSMSHPGAFIKLPDEARTSNHEVAPVGRASVGNRKNTADGNLH